MNNKINFPANWDYVALKEIHNTNKISTINPQRFTDETFEYYSIPAYQKGKIPLLEKGQNINSNKLILNVGTILFGKLNPRVEKVWTVKNHSNYRKIGSTEWIPISPGNDVDSDFIFFVLWSEFIMPLAKQNVSGSTPSRQRVDPSSFYKFKIPLPPIEEQRKIAIILSLVQDAITQQEQLITLTIELKKTLIQKLFTEGTRGEPQKMTEIGLIPESWDVVKLKGAAESFQYGTSVKCDYDKDGKPVLRIPNVIGGYVDISDLKYGQPKSNEIESLKLLNGDLLFVRTNGTKENSGRCSMYRGELEDDCYFASYLIRVRVDKTELSPAFLDEYTRTEIGTSFLSGQAIRTADGKFNINSGTLQRMLVPKPSLDEQREIADILSNIDTKISNYLLIKEQLEDLFRTLLHQLMTAQIRVDDLNTSVLNLELQGEDE